MAKLAAREWETTYSVFLASSTATADRTTKKVEALSTVLVKFSTNTLVTEAQTHWTLVNLPNGKISSAMEVIRPGEAFASDVTIVVGPPVSFSPTSSTSSGNLEWRSSRTSQEDHANPADVTPTKQTSSTASEKHGTLMSSPISSTGDNTRTSDRPSLTPTDGIDSQGLSEPHANKNHRSNKLILATALPVTISVLIVLLLAIAWYGYRRRKRPASQGDFNAQPLGQAEKRQTWSQTSFSTNVDRSSSGSAGGQATSNEVPDLVLTSERS